MNTYHLVRNIALASALSLGAATAAYAVPVSFDIDGLGSSVSIVVNSNNTGATNPTVSLAGGLDGNIFDLDLDGGPTSHTFNFFNLNVAGPSTFAAGSIDADISATLVFSDPTASAGGGGDVSLTYNASFFSSGSVSGSLAWDPQPANVLLANGTEFSVAFDDLPSINGGNNPVGATVTLLNGPTNRPPGIPEPATLALIAMGLIGVGLTRRRISLND